MTPKQYSAAPPESDHTTSPARLVVTPGEPAGIGPDILLQWAYGHLGRNHSSVTAIADPDMLSERADLLGIPVEPCCIDSLQQARPAALNVLPCRTARQAIPGRLDSANAAYVLQTLERAAELCLTGAAQAMITGPVQKSVINDAGYRFSGHTEFLAALATKARKNETAIEPVMMLATPVMRVALVTTHLPLRDVAEHITADKLRHCLLTLNHALRHDFAIDAPRILVAGLNPHAGENGHLGREEIDIITPVLDECRGNGLDVRGPLPADTLFTPQFLEQADAVLAMYHDQGLPVLKHAGFGQAVNITLGLPMVRTSVDHGTALELAGSGRADSGSLAYAIDIAEQISLSRQQGLHRSEA